MKWGPEQHPLCVICIYIFLKMTNIPPDEPQEPQGSTTQRDQQTLKDKEQTQRLLEENRALRELLAAQVQATLPPHQPNLLRRLGWGLISAPGAVLVRWRELLGHDEARPITGKRLGYATLTVLYTLAIYGALVLLVVSWSSPNTARSGATAAGPQRVPLTPLEPIPPEPPPLMATPEAIFEPETHTATPAQPAAAAPEPPSSIAPIPAAEPHTPPTPEPATNAPTGPRSTLRITEIPAQNPWAWLDALRGELARCAQLGFFERPDCAWAARKQFCEPHRAWGTVKECPSRP